MTTAARPPDRRLTTPSSRTLLGCAYLVGEPGTTFTAEELAEFINGGSNAAVPTGPTRHTGELEVHSLPALGRRGLVEYTGEGRWALTDKGFDHAVFVTGGYGLL